LCGNAQPRAYFQQFSGILGLQWRRGEHAGSFLFSGPIGPKPIEPVGCGEAIWTNEDVIPAFVEGLLQETASDSQYANIAFMESPKQRDNRVSTYTANKAHASWPLWSFRRST
jgi:hypothetical protein